MKHIVHIYGPCGSGTSTLGREIGRRLGFRFLDTDDFFWLPTDPQYTQKRPLEERLALLEEELDKPGDVVLSGALIPWGNPLIPRLRGWCGWRRKPSCGWNGSRPGSGQTLATASNPAGTCARTFWNFWNTPGATTPAA